MATFGHSGVVLFMTDALEEYLCMEKNLKELPEYSRMTVEEKVKFDTVFKAFKAVKKEFSRNYLKRAVADVTKAHQDDTDSDDYVEILKSIRSVLFCCINIMKIRVAVYSE